MRYDDKLKVCRRTAVWTAALALLDVLGMEFGYISQEMGDHALTIFILLLALALIINFVLKNRNK